VRRKVEASHWLLLPNRLLPLFIHVQR
jgi:hypothetical protein